jgi:hypothetical protein
MKVAYTLVGVWHLVIFYEQMTKDGVITYFTGTREYLFEDWNYESGGPDLHLHTVRSGKPYYIKSGEEILPIEDFPKKQFLISSIFNDSFV